MRKNSALGLTFEFFALPFTIAKQHKVQAQKKQYQQQQLNYQQQLKEEGKCITQQLIDLYTEEAVETFITNCGDIVVFDVYRCPDLTAEIVVIYDDEVSKPYKRKIYKDKMGYYFKMDNEKWYFRQPHDEFYTELLEID